jgi:outer membrane protein OmpA-like peptidoglycan-associated protein
MTLPTRVPAALSAIAIIAAASTASAQDTRPREQDIVMPRGLYLGFGGGANFMEDNDVRFGAVDSKTKYDVGPSGLASIGYGFPFGLRLELEGGYRSNGVDKVDGASGDGSMEIGSAMLNAIYDVPLPTFGIPVIPHVGAGVGYAHLWNRSLPHGPGGATVKGQDDTIAFQGIAGVDYVVTPQLVAGLDYRYFVAHNADFGVAGTGADAHVGDVGNHTVLATLRWYFNAPPARPAPAPVAATPPAAAATPAATPTGPRVFNVFFDFDRSELSPEARTIVAEAARYAQEGGAARVMVTGHADRAGPDRHNQVLSERRALSVRDELVRQGVADGEIATAGRGESDPAVPTPDGVREPRNRRVEITLQSAGA